jgi:uncharacterized membrane protein
MRKTLITGFITLLPIVVTIMIISWMFDFLTSPFFGAMEHLVVAIEKSLGVSLEKHHLLITFITRLLVLVAIFLMILLLGFFGRKFFVKFLLKMVNKILLKIPFVGTIYRLTKDVASATFSPEEKTFKETVLVPFLSSETHALGFVTGEIPKALKDVIQEADVTVFVPTAPHPISGFMLMTPKKMAIPVDMSTEDTFKFLFSCGMIHPKEGQSPSKE